MSPAHDADVESVERFIPAPAAEIFALIADPARHDDIDGSGTLRGAKGEAQQLHLGSRFGMSMKMGVPYTTVNEVVEFEQDRLIAWQTKSDTPLLGSLIGGRIWRYELEPGDGGTLVRESWDIRKERVKAFVRPLRGKTIAAMAKTLERIEEIVVTAS